MDNGQKRQLGIPTVVDRVVQQAIAQVLIPIYEPQFSDLSYGFRPRRNGHQALKKCRDYITAGYGYAVDLDLEKFFDKVNHSKLIEVLSRTVKDGRVVSLIHRYLNAGVQVGGKVEASEMGVPRGGPFSGLLANMFLHFTFDRWMAKYYPKMQFERYSDDIIVHCVSNKQAAFMKIRIAERLNECGLSMNGAKTKIVYCRNDRNRENPETASSFDFLGYTFKPRYCPIKEGSN